MALAGARNSSSALGGRRASSMAPAGASSRRPILHRQLLLPAVAHPPASPGAPQLGSPAAKPWRLRTPRGSRDSRQRRRGRRGSAPSSRQRRCPAAFAAAGLRLPARHACLPACLPLQRRWLAPCTCLRPVLQPSLCATRVSGCPPSTCTPSTPTAPHRRRLRSLPSRSARQACRNQRWRGSRGSRCSRHPGPSRARSRGGPRRCAATANHTAPLLLRRRCPPCATLKIATSSPSLLLLAAASRGLVPGVGQRGAHERPGLLCEHRWRSCHLWRLPGGHHWFG